MRELIEFQCEKCSGFFLLNLRLQMEGCYAFACPSCDKEHARSVAKSLGKVRARDRLCLKGIGHRMTQTKKKPEDRVVVPKSAFSKVSRIEEVERGGYLADSFMDKNRPIDWLTEWHKMDEQPVISQPKSLWGILRSLVSRGRRGRDGIETPRK